MSQGIGGVGGSGSVSGVGSLGTCTSVNFIFAKLQMELAASAKDSALGYIKQIESAQAEQKEVADLLQQARQAQNEGENGTGVGQKSINGVTVTGKDCYPMSKELATFMEQHELTFPHTDKDYILGKDEWDVAIQSLQAYQETIGTDIQTLMVYVQDFMGQYNSYTQGANSAIQSGMQTLTSVARGQ